MDILVQGVNHRTAPLELRERLAFLPEELRDALHQHGDHASVSEIVLLSTCNRTEFYVITNSIEATLEAQRELVRSRKGVDLGDEAPPYVHVGRECVTHLFRVAGGVDSMVLGEPGILGQVKTAFEVATEAGTAGVVLGKLFPKALRVGKRARSETQIARGAVSLEKAGIQLSQKVFGDLSRRGALVIGAGETAERSATLLREAGIRRLLFANRTPEKAAELAQRLGGTSHTLDELEQARDDVEIVVSAVNVREPVLTEKNLGRVLDGRLSRPLLVVDLGVPRNVEPALGKSENVFLYAVDDLQELVNLNLGRRQKEVGAVEEIVVHEVNGFYDWLLSLETQPILKAMRERADEIRQETLARYARNRSEEEKALLEKFSVGLLQKFLHSPTILVRRADPGTPEGVSQLEWARRLFAENLGRNGDGPEDEE